MLKPAKEAAEEFARFARESVGIHPFPEKLQRPYEADYPHGAPANSAERLGLDIDGDPLTVDSRRIAGRRVVGGPDEAIPPTEYDAIIREGTGKEVHYVDRSEIDGGHGGTFVDPKTKKPTKIGIANDLDAPDRIPVKAHEIGHMVDELAGEIETTNELLPELHRIYTAGRTGIDRESNFITPQRYGYNDEEAPRELWTEALRAYISNANYIKSVAPTSNSSPRSIRCMGDGWGGERAQG